MSRTRGRRHAAALATLVALALLATSCGDPGTDDARGEPSGTPTAPAEPGDPTDAAETDDPSEPAADPDHAVEAPGPLKGALRPADMLISSQEGLSDAVVKRIEKLDGVVAVERIGLSLVTVENRAVAVAAVDPASYRRFTIASSAQQQEIWDRVAGGELAIPQKLGKKLQEKGAFVRLGNDKDAPRLHIGAYAEQVPSIDAVVNEKWGKELGVPEGNALIVSTGIDSPQSVRGRVQKALGGEPSIQLLDAVTRFGLDPDAVQNAIPTGGSVARAVGSFSYRVLGGGRIAPDPAWVAANIRTEQVPILGSVTCHKVMLPQLRAALREISEAGLADAINPRQYAGCFYPRFIANTTSLSNHSFGIAVDLNTPGNQRGTVGEMDRTVVAIFKRWGFAWGGDWRYTDPMHFEMNALVEAD